MANPSPPRRCRWPAYRQSKLANLLFTHELQRRLAAAGAPVIAMGALPTLRAATDPEVQGDEYYGPDRLLGTRGHPVRAGSSRASRDPETARRLWERSVALTGVDPGV